MTTLADPLGVDFEETAGYSTRLFPSEMVIGPNL